MARFGRTYIRPVQLVTPKTIPIIIAIAGIVSTSAWAAPAGTLTSSLTGVTAALSVTAPAGSVSGGANVPQAVKEPWVGTTALTSGASTTLVFDITGAATGDWVYVFLVGKTNETSITLTGWTQVGTIYSQSLIQFNAVYRRQKQIGDTTFTVTLGTSTTFIAQPISWPGLDPTTPDEGLNGQLDSSANNVFTTPSSTPGFTNRWAVGFFSGENGNSSFRTVTWTPSGLVDRVQATNTTAIISAYPSLEIADSDGPISMTSQQLSSTTSGTNGLAVNNGFGGMIFLIPAPNTAITPNITTTPYSGSLTLTANISGPVATIATAVSAGVVGISFSVPGVVATETTTPFAGSVTSTANINGVVANATGAAPSGSISYTAAGIVATAAWSVPTGSGVSAPIAGAVSHSAWVAPAGGKTVALTGVVTTIATAAPVGTLSLGRSIPGVVATVATAAISGGISSSVSGSQTNVLWSVSPNINVGVGTTITGVVAAVTISSAPGVAGVVTAITGLVSNSNVAAPAGTLTIVTAATVTGVVSTATSAAPAGQIDGSVDTAPTAAAIWRAVSGGVSSIVFGVNTALTTAAVGALHIDSFMSGVLVDSTITAPVGSVIAQNNITVAGVVSTLSTAAFTGPILLSQNLTGVPATIIVLARVGIPQGNTNIVASTVTINTAAFAGAVLHNAQVVGLAANNTAVALAGNVRIDKPIIGGSANMSVVAPTGIIITGVGIRGPVIAINWDALEGTVGIASFFASANGHSFSDGDCFLRLVETLGVVQLNMVPATTILVEDG